MTLVVRHRIPKKTWYYISKHQKKILKYPKIYYSYFFISPIPSLAFYIFYHRAILSVVFSFSVKICYSVCVYVSIKSTSQASLSYKEQVLMWTHTSLTKHIPRNNLYTWHSLEHNFTILITPPLIHCGNTLALHYTYENISASAMVSVIC